MDLVLIELVLWIGLLFFFWALKEGLGNVESDIESLGLVTNARRGGRVNRNQQFYHPEQVTEPIGTYRDAQIYRYAVIEGRTYQFDRVCPADSGMTLEPAERYVAPGLVYRECAIPVRQIGALRDQD